jgi:hypothetical protein
MLAPDYAKTKRIVYKNSHIAYKNGYGQVILMFETVSHKFVFINRFEEEVSEYFPPLGKSICLMKTQPLVYKLLTICEIVSTILLIPQVRNKKKFWIYKTISQSSCISSVYPRKRQNQNEN